MIAAVDRTVGYGGETIVHSVIRMNGHGNQEKDPELRRLIKSKGYYVCVVATLPVLYRLDANTPKLLAAESVVNLFYAAVCKKCNTKCLNTILSKKLPQVQNLN